MRKRGEEREGERKWREDRERRKEREKKERKRERERERERERDGCVLPWEECCCCYVSLLQITHKHYERRLLVAESCGVLAPYIPV